MLKRLEANGFVRRERSSPKDERLVECAHTAGADRAQGPVHPGKSFSARPEDRRRSRDMRDAVRHITGRSTLTNERESA